MHAPQTLGKEIDQPERLRETIQAQQLCDPRGQERHPHASGAREQAVEDRAVEPVGVFRPPLGGIGVALCRPEWFDQSPVLHARRTGGLATAAIQAQVERPLDRGREFQATIHDRPHQIDTTSRTEVFVARLQIRRTERRTQTAMNAVEELLVVDVRPRTRRAPRRRDRSG